MPNDFDDLNAPGGSLDEFLAEEADAKEPSTDEEPSDVFGSYTLPQDQVDSDRELTLYGAMLLAAEAALDALDGKTLTPQADAFRVYLDDFRNQLTE